MKNPLEVAGVSGSIARVMPVEGGPATEAMFKRNNVVKASWGHYASTLLEYWSERGENYEPAQILELLGVDSEMLRDNRVQFQQSSYPSFSEYTSDRMAVFRKQAEQYFAPEAERLCEIIDVVMSGYTVDQTVATEEIKGIRTQLKGHVGNDEFTKLALRDDALESGVVIDLAEFVDTMLKVQTIQPGEFQSELSRTWLRGVRNALGDVKNNYRKYGVYKSEKQKVNGVVVGRDAFLTVKRTLRQAEKEISGLSQEMWAIIQPAFTAPKLAEHPLITGKHN